jgi:hypothetical protein
MKKTDKNKPLPTPPTVPFGRKKQFEDNKGHESLTADRMAAALAEGRLDEFIKQEMPDNEYARNLASMMLGMTGMMPGTDVIQGVPSALNPHQPPSAESEIPEHETAAHDIPEDIQSAIKGGDVQGVMDILRREYLKRSPEANAGLPKTQTAESHMPGNMPVFDKETIDALISIAKENDVTLDWLILRAIKVFVREYANSGRL